MSDSTDNDFEVVSPRPMEDVSMPVDQAAERLGVRQHEVLRRLRLGELGGVRTKSGWLVSRDSVERLVRKGQG